MKNALGGDSRAASDCSRNVSAKLASKRSARTCKGFPAKPETSAGGEIHVFLTRSGLGPVLSNTSLFN